MALICYSSELELTAMCSGPSILIDKRTAAIEARAIATPRALQTCSPWNLRSACHSLLPNPTTTVKATSTSYRCTTTLTTTNTFFDHTVYTSTYTFYVEPPPAQVTENPTAILTLTVPSACASSAHVAPTGADNLPPGLNIYPMSYPYFASSSLDCCLICHQFTDCVASAFIPSGGECDLLINGSPAIGPDLLDIPGPGGCPSGIIDYKFGPPVEQTNIDDSVYIFPGPCGK
jgi:hypothetical protein